MEEWNTKKVKRNEMKNLHNSNKPSTFAPVLETRRDGRVVDCGGLENRWTERFRGFESLSLRNKRWKSADCKTNTQFYTQECKVGVFVLFKIIQPLHNKDIKRIRWEKTNIYLSIQFDFSGLYIVLKVFVIVFQRQEWIIIQVFCVDRISFCLMYESTYL